MPLVQTLFNPGLRERHWEQISEIVGFMLKPDESFSLSKLVDMNLEPFVTNFEGISESASKEFSLEKAMEKMRADWAPVSIICFAFSYLIFLVLLRTSYLNYLYLF